MVFDRFDLMLVKKMANSQLKGGISNESGRGHS